jgi:uncharacterized protein (TIGR00251 family)
MRMIKIKVHPRAKIKKVTVGEDGSFTLHVHSPPIDDKANEEVIDTLAQFLKLPKSKISIKRGFKSSHKIIQVDDT